MRYLFVILLLLIPVPTLADSYPSSLEIEIHYMINEERQRNGLSVLLMHSTLIDVARAHSQDMLDNNFFQHENLQGLKPADRVDQAGITYSTMAENLYFSVGTSKSSVAKAAVEGWIESPGHYLNMLSYTSYTGIGVAVSGDTYYITQLFVESFVSEMSVSGTIYDNDFEIVEDNSLTQGEGLMIALGILVFLKLLDKYSKNKRK